MVAPGNRRNAVPQAPFGLNAPWSLDLRCSRSLSQVRRSDGIRPSWPSSATESLTNASWA